MADELRQFEAVLGAISNITSESSGDDAIAGARCPKCNASDFVKASDLYDAARARLEEPDFHPDVLRGITMTDAELVDRFAPPRRGSVMARAIGAAVPLGAIGGYVYYRFGSGWGEAALIAAGVMTVIIGLTSARRLSDRYYDQRARWRKLYMCRRCGQRVAV